MTGVLTDMTTQRNPGFFNFVGGDGQVTVAEKRASDRGVAARGTSGFTSGRDRCRRGKACGVTCIDAREDCILDFPEPVQKEIRRMAKFVMERNGIAGANDPLAQQRFLQETDLGRSQLMVGKHLTKKTTLTKNPTKANPSGLVESRSFGTTAQGQKQYVKAREIAGLRSQKDKIGDAQPNASLMKAWQQEVNSRGIRLNKKDLEDLFDSLPESARKQLQDSGNPGNGKKKWYGQDKDGNDIVVTSGTRARGLAVLDMYIRQGGTDAYQPGGKTYSPADLDVEHVKPVSKGGLDHPSNWVLARSGSQRLRADQHLGEWIDSLPDPNDRVAMAHYMDVRRKTDAAKRAAKALSEMAYNRRGEMTDEEWYAIPNKKRQQVTQLAGGKEKLPRREAVGEYMFMTGGKKDGFLAGAALHDPRKGGAGGGGEGTRAGTIAAPEGWKSAYAMYRKDHTAEQSFAFRDKINDVWKTFAKDGTSSYDDMASAMKSLFKSNLTSNQFKLVEKDIDKGNANFKSSWGSKGPGASKGSNTAPTVIGGVNVAGLKPGQIGVLRKMENAGMSSSDIREVIDGMKSGD